MKLSKFISTAVEQIKTKEHPQVFTGNNLFKTQNLIDALKDNRIETPFILLGHITAKNDISTTYKDKETGNNLIHQAIESTGQPKFIKYLVTLSEERLESGQALTAKNKNGQTPLELAEQKLGLGKKTEQKTKFTDTDMPVFKENDDIGKATDVFVKEIESSMKDLSSRTEMLTILINAEKKSSRSYKIKS